MVTRMSSLPMAERCGASAALASQVDAGSVASLKGDAYHAWFPTVYAPNPDEYAEPYSRALMALPEEERPDFEDLIGKTRLEFVPPWSKDADLHFEIPLGINEWQEPVEYDDLDAMARGTADVAWTAEVEFPDHGKQRAAAVLDHKSGQWVQFESHLLQLLGYGFAWAAKNSARFFSCYLHPVREAKTIPIHVDRDSVEGSELWQRVLNACNTPRDKFIAGGHCRDCFQRTLCPARMLPPAVLQDKLSPVAKGRDMTPSEVIQVLDAAAAMEDEAKAAKEAAQNWVRINGPIRSDGKIFDGFETRGRRTAKVGDLEKAGLSQYIATSKPGVRFEWRKDRRK